MAGTTITKKELEKRIRDSYEVQNNAIGAVPCPVVSVRTSAYQHAPYIKQCLEAVLSQKTDFPFEYIIGEDFSSDGTREIVLEYAKKHPDVVRVITADYNVGVRANGLRCMRACRGKYLAMCEGDDYWTDPNKLQKQVDFLEQHPDYAFCFHPVQVVVEGKEGRSYIFPTEKKKSDFNTKHLLKRNFIQTNSVVLRRLSASDFPLDVMPGDWYQFLYHAQFGKIGFINKVMAVYRRHSGGLWWNSINNLNEIWRKHGLGHLALYMEVLKIYGENPVYRRIICENIIGLLQNLDELDRLEGSDLVKQGAEKYPHLITLLIEYYDERLKEKSDVLEEKDTTISTLQSELAEKTGLLHDRERTISELVNSKTWKTGRFIAKLIGR